MKEKVISVILLLSLMASLPFAAVKLSGEKNAEIQTSATADNALKNVQTDEILYGLTAAKYEDGYCDEAIKAIAIILNTDYIADKNFFDLKNKNDYIDENNLKNKLGSKYKKFKASVDEVAKKTLCSGGKTSFVPFSKISNGKTVKSEKYKYIISVASPWDCYSSDYNETASCFGASLDGINYLCENGSSAEDALLWYFPNMKISDIV